jgi:hypothetical protein
LKEAPYDYAVASDYLTTKYGVKAPYAEVRAVLEPRLEYDTRALSTAEQFAPTVNERQALLRTSCDLSARQCISLGWELASAVDAVEMSTDSGWLVTYHNFL